ncbi:MAG: sirohydrochlorin cobaltochelatase [Proteobacteria bacterium]|nr:sirohydrochlorin cobaltochelatase [Pseudomonadota bacterium]MBU1610553.1 sirohydrochlorin cobaltochelatase [Pseudomonadota bacterium]
MNTAILLAAHGSRRPESRAALETVSARVRAAYPDAACALAFTSAHILTIMRQSGETADDVESALNKLHDQGYRRVAVQSLHIIPGREFHEMEALANRLMVRDERFERIEVGKPLLACEEDLVLVAEALMKLVPEDRKPDEAVVFIGHGTAHSGNEFYPALNRKLQDIDPLVFMGVMGRGSGREPSVATISKWLTRAGVTRAALMPFLFGAGYHAAFDLMGSKADSWETVLGQLGIACRGELKGSGEYSELANIWLAHLADAMARLKRR